VLFDGVAVVVGGLQVYTVTRLIPGPKAWRAQRRLTGKSAQKDELGVQEFPAGQP